MTTTPEPKIVIHEVHQAAPTSTPCQPWRHRWAWLASGGQACGNCGLGRTYRP